MNSEIIEVLGAMAARFGSKTGANGKISFFKAFLKNPQEVGSIIPSSRFLERKIVEMGEVGTAKTVIELGSGTGGTTQAILKAMRSDAHLLSIEINPDLHKSLQTIDDPRLIAHLGSADDLQAIVAGYGLNPPDVVISGIPFSMMSRSQGEQILHSVRAALPNEGRFVAYQFRSRVSSLCKPLMGDARVNLELLNIPPMRVYQWKKAV